MRSTAIELPYGMTEQTVRAFVRLNQMEIWFRELLYLELKAFYGANWWLEVTSAFRQRGGLKVDAPLKSDKRHPHMLTPENDPLWFISFDVLLKILFSPRFWNRFKVYLTTKSLLRERLTEITAVRNRVAHCRNPHRLDIARIENLMRDLDEGFWKFCTSYNTRYMLQDVDPVGNWLKSNSSPSSVSINASISGRPSASKAQRNKFGSGWFYNFTFIQPNTSRYLNYPEILAWTKRLHPKILHIILDSMQLSIRVTVPAVLPSEDVIAVVETFRKAVGNCYGMSRAYNIRDSEGSWIQYEKQMRVFEEMSAKWPHYVLPPSHPFAILDSTMPCSIFEVGDPS